MEKIETLNSFRLYFYERNIDKGIFEDNLASKAINKLKKFNSIISKIDINKIDEVLKNSAEFLKKYTIKNYKITEIDKIGTSLGLRLLKLNKELKILKDDLQTQYFDEIMDILKGLAKSIVFHVDMQKEYYKYDVSKKR